MSRPVELVEIKPSDLGAYQRYVGGHLELVKLDDPEAGIYLHSEGKLEGLELNQRATSLSWVHNSAMRGVDVIVGDTLLVGGANRNGDDLSVPKYFRDIMFTEGRVTLRYKRNQIRGWVKSDVLFAQWDQAYHFGASFMHQTPEITRLQVVPVS